MILRLDYKTEINPSIILKEESKVIDFTHATKLPYEIITKRLNIPNSDQSRYDNWYSIMHESYYFKNRTYLQNILNELLGVQLSKYMGFTSIEYELAILNGKIIGLLSKNFRKDNTKYLYATELTKRDHRIIAHYLTAKTSILNLEYKRELYNYIMRLYYAASFDLTINVLCERKGFLPHLSTLFDYEKSLMDTKEDAIYDPFIDLYISGKTIKTILDNNPSMEKSINKVLGFNMKDALEKIEEQYNISIPDEVKNKYLEYDSSRKEFMEEKIYTLK